MVVPPSLTTSRSISLFRGWTLAMRVLSPLDPRDAILSVEVTATKYDCNPVGISINCSCGSWQVLASSGADTFFCAWNRGQSMTNATI